MKKVKKVIYLSLVLTSMIASLSLAQFYSRSISTITAEAKVTGGQLAMSIEIRRRTDNVVVSSITWHLAAGTTQWALAEQYILLHSTLTQSGGGIRIYTDNAAADANPKYGGTFGEGNGAGLIDTSTNTVFLPMAWLIKDDVGDPATGDPQTNSNWFYFKDKSQTNFWTSTTKDYSRVALAGFGYHYAQDEHNYGAMSSPNPIYIEANFLNAVGGRTYRTTTLRIELYSE